MILYDHYRGINAIAHNYRTRINETKASTLHTNCTNNHLAAIVWSRYLDGVIICYIIGVARIRVHNIV
jgi:hypothetical protein